MPINTFDASEMKQNLNSYIAEINDLATSPEFVDKYAGFITAVYDLQALTNSYSVNGKAATTYKFSVVPFDANGNPVDSYTLYVSTYAAPQPEAAPLMQDVTVRWMLTDGTVLTEQTVTLTEGVPQTFQRMAFDGYEPEESTPEAITVTLAGDGSLNPGAPVFYYHIIPAAPLTQDVTVRWMLTDGTVLTEQTVTLTEGVPQTFQRLAFDGYEPEESTPETITVTLAGDGSLNPGAPVFYYHVKPAAPLTQDVTVRWMLTDGTVLTEQTVTLTEGVPQTFQRLALDGYEPYRTEEFPKWSLNLRRAECIFFGGIPIAYPLTALAFSVANKDTSFVQNLAIACSVSAAIALIDYIIGVVNET